jgi:ABC-type multidrug transport system ATPase subunit
VAFVGPTGAGKSSILQLVMRFYDVDEGAVLFDGHDVRQVTLASLRGQLGVVFQDTFLFDTTIRENIAMGRPGASDDEIEAAARAAELHDFVQTLPRGYSTLVGERGGRLSGGQRQRLAIARALLRQPRVLLLDEATSALDPRTERLISDTLERVGQGRTVVAVTHRLSSITAYDRIFVMASGRLVEQGTHAELLAGGGLYAELWAEQTAGAMIDAPFDAVAALSAVHLFFGLSRTDLEEAAGLLRSRQLAAGERVVEGGSLYLVRRGRARVLGPGLDGRLVPAAELAAGDAFGIAALAGDETGAVLVADEPVGLLVLDGDGLAAVAARHPSVAAALAGHPPAAVAPSGGSRLSRTSLVLRSVQLSAGAGGAFGAGGEGPGGPGPAGRPGPEDVRRMSSAFRAVPS